MKKLCKYNIKVLFALVNISPFEYQNILCEAMNTLLAHIPDASHCPVISTEMDFTGLVWPLNSR
jgi:hypothetical protein